MVGGLAGQVHGHPNLRIFAIAVEAKLIINIRETRSMALTYCGGIRLRSPAAVELGKGYPVGESPGAGEAERCVRIRDLGS